MKISTVSTLAMLSLGVALGPVRLMAYDPIHATIPFDFTVGTKSLAAGDYRVTAAPFVLAIQGMDGSSAVLTTTHSAEPNRTPGSATLMFHRYGNRYFLSQIAEGDRGWELDASAVERELAAKSASPRPIVVVASRTK
jgi:hypothetical protein